MPETDNSNVSTIENTLPLTESTDRRGFVRGMMAATIGAGALLAYPSVAHAETGQTGINGWFDVTASPYNATGNGTTDDGPAIQKAINAAGAAGGVIWFPPGRFLINTGVVVNNSVLIMGSGWCPTNWSNGTFIYVTNTSVAPITFGSGASGALMRDIGFLYSQPSPASGWAPGAYNNYAITVNATDVRLENIFLVNPTNGIQICGPNNTTAVGRVTLNRIFGQPLHIGIYIDNALDTIKVDNVHFWPFWSTSSYVLSYQYSSSWAVGSFRNDNPHFSNFFAFNYGIGFYYTSSGGTSPTICQGITSRFHMSNIDLDSNGMGIYIDGPSTTGQVSNLTYCGYSPITSGNGNCGIMSNASGCWVQGTNMRFTNVPNAAVRCAGSGSCMNVENLVVDSFNVTGQGVTAVYADSGGTIWLGFSRAFGTGGGAGATGGAGTIHIDS